MTARYEPILLSLFLLTSCGGGQPTAEHAEHRPPLSAEPEPEAAPVSAPVTNPRLAEALDELCRVATEENADRSRPVEVRLDRMEDRFDDSEHHEVLDAFFDRVERRAQENIFFEEIAAQADDDGVPGYRCEQLARMLVLQAAGDDDIDLSLVASPESDLERLCAIATEVLGEAAQNNISPAVVDHTIAMRVEAELTNPSIRNAFDAIAMIARTSAYQEFLEVANDVGAHGWTCPPLERFWSAPPPTP